VTKFNSSLSPFNFVSQKSICRELTFLRSSSKSSAVYLL
jgi:hypothetical protein